ncbi:34883_t:CDS:1, partial [Gigaspora margarita]
METNPNKEKEKNTKQVVQFPAIYKTEINENRNDHNHLFTLTTKTNYLLPMQQIKHP